MARTAPKDAFRAVVDELVRRGPYSNNNDVARAIGVKKGTLYNWYNYDDRPVPMAALLAVQYVLSQIGGTEVSVHKPDGIELTTDQAHHLVRQLVENNVYDLAQQMLALIIQAQKDAAD